MLLPDNINPELTIYYNGSLILAELKNNNFHTIIDLYQSLESEMTFKMFVLCLDWLYLINVAQINDEGDVKLCL